MFADTSAGKVERKNLVLLILLFALTSVSLCWKLTLTLGMFCVCNGSFGSGHAKDWEHLGVCLHMWNYGRCWDNLATENLHWYRVSFCWASQKCRPFWLPSSCLAHPSTQCRIYRHIACEGNKVYIHTAAMLNTPPQWPTCRSNLKWTAGSKELGVYSSVKGFCHLKPLYVTSLTMD